MVVVVKSVNIIRKHVNILQRFRWCLGFLKFTLVDLFRISTTI